MRILKFIILVYLMSFADVFSQIPSDFISKEFHKERRNILRSKMPKNTLTVVFSNPIRNRANDVDYVFHQNPNFYYLTGYREPNGVLVLFSDNQTDAEGKIYNEILYVQKRDSKAELWNGKRLGVEGAKRELGFAVVKNNSEFLSSNLNLRNFDKIFIEKFNDDYRNLNGVDIFDLIKSFKIRSAYDPSLYLSEMIKYAYSNVAETPIESSANVIHIIDRMAKSSIEVKNNELLNKYKSAENDELRKEIKKKISFALKPKTNIDLTFLSSNMATMREVKTNAELVLLTKAIRISAIGQNEVMKAMKPHMSETELQGIHEFVYKKYGAEYEGYPSIVGAGNNGCILHYIENNKTKVGNDLVLMDLGAEYRGYTADVTRTIPANGKFTKEQKLIYDLVYKAQEAGIALYTKGTSMGAPNQLARKIINEGLFELGIIKSVDERHNYLPHGTLHHIGLDVHDPGNYRNFEKNMVVTMEPGIYIPEGSSCDKKWWGIAVRIEDDILVTDGLPVNLSAESPRKSDEIEKMMSKPSVLNDFILPDLD